MEIVSNPIVINNKIPDINKTEKKSNDKDISAPADISIKKDDLKRASIGLIAGAVPASGVSLLGSYALKEAAGMAAGHNDVIPTILGKASPSLALVLVTGSAASALLGDGKAGKGALIGAATGAVSSVIPVLKYKYMPVIAISAVLGAVVGAGAGAASSYVSGKIIK